MTRSFSWGPLAPLGVSLVLLLGLVAGGPATSAAAEQPAAAARPAAAEGPALAERPAGAEKTARKRLVTVQLGIFSQLPGLTTAESLAKRERQLGRKFAFVNHYYDFTDPFPGSAEKADVDGGRTPMVTWWGTPNAEVTSGSRDDVIRARAQAVKSFGRPIYLRYGAEMNGNWYSWSGALNGNDPSTFVAAWRHIHDIFTEVGADNAIWVWAPNADSKPGGYNTSSWNSWRNYYPGDAYVDWVGIDGYNWGGSSWETFGQIFGPVYNDYAGRKPIMIAETSSVEQGGSKASWIKGARDWIKTHPGVRALSWFDTSLSATGIDWRVDSSRTSWRAFKALAADSAFAG